MPSSSIPLEDSSIGLDRYNTSTSKSSTTNLDNSTILSSRPTSRQDTSREDSRGRDTLDLLSSPLDLSLELPNITSSPTSNLELEAISNR